METFIAYRLPFENTPHFLSGSGKWISNLSESGKEGIILHSFKGDQILFVDRPTPINPTDFKVNTAEVHFEAADKETYLQNFRNLKAEIMSGRFKKVILSRTQMVKTTKEALEIFEALNEKYKNTFNYVISNSKTGTWIGATPERLISIENENVETMSLAGTKTPEEQWSPKEEEEQRLVTETIISNLTAGKCHSILTEGPTTIKAGAVEHLKTKITAIMPHSDNWIKLVEGLHPTPAVCGIPTQEAKRFIPKLEGYNRQFYTGFIGIITPKKKNFFVNLRCMELFKNVAKLYIGGGITAPSEVHAEWRETERKSTTLANVLH